MARPTTISDDAILEAAREVFLERGPSATTAEVAARAGVSEGSIFKRWRTKDALFFACMAPVPIAEMGWIAKLPARVGTRTFRENLEEIALEIVALFRLIMPSILMQQAMGEQHRRMSDFETAPPIVARRKLAAYLDAERKLGRVRAIDVDVMARAMLGALFSFVHLEVSMAGQDPSPIAAETYVRGFIEILVAGAVPADATSKPKRR
ncbi:TetR/AcrR family transcriptional regulator [Sandaracinus amylolyticus]|uniref:TetR/AcrR family transcriptional regulator n=1 Tax=Sandaracinus amylolyticus TaxID=927083 RepID=UPI001F420193|nr:TetR/AcrR family transcriptional regulator [Sandaracinus amylolyticus]UJR79534.1 Transcriptional regulator [Sandaracinus amylolyticus]